MTSAPTACRASCKAKSPLAGLYLRQIVETARSNGPVRSHLSVERPQRAQRLPLLRLPVVGGAMALRQEGLVAAIEGAFPREHVFDSTWTDGQPCSGFHRPD